MGDNTTFLIITETWKTFSTNFQLSGIKLSFSVLDVKARIQVEREFPLHIINLSYNGEILDDNNSLLDYGISQGDRLVMQFRKGYIVRNVTGGRNAYYYYPKNCDQWTVQKLKNEIIKDQGFPEDTYFTLIYNTTMMQNHRTLESYNVQEGTSINLTKRVYGGNIFK